MRKRNFSFAVDKCVWTIILLLPLLFTLIFGLVLKNYDLENLFDILPNNNIANSIVNMFNFLDSNINFATDPIYSGLYDLLNADSGIIPIFTENAFVLKYLSYFVWVEILHVLIDFLVFIPRLAHKWQEDLTCGD